MASATASAMARCPGRSSPPPGSARATAARVSPRSVVWGTGSTVVPARRGSAGRWGRAVAGGARGPALGDGTEDRTQRLGRSQETGGFDGDDQLRVLAGGD